MSEPITAALRHRVANLLEHRLTRDRVSPDAEDEVITFQLPQKQYRLLISALRQPAIDEEKALSLGAVIEEALEDNATEWAEVMRVVINNVHEDDWAEILSSIRHGLGLSGGPEGGDRTGVDRLDLTRLIASVLGIPAAAIVVTDLKVS